MNFSMIRNLGAWLKSRPALAAVSIVAASGDDDAWKNGITFDRNTVNQKVQSAALVVMSTISGISGGDTSTLSVKFEDSADGSTWAAYEYRDAASEAPESVIYSADGTYTKTYSCNFAGARRYVRAVVKHSLTAAGTDAAQTSAVWVLGPADEMPLSGAGAT